MSMANGACHPRASEPLAPDMKESYVKVREWFVVDICCIVMLHWEGEGQVRNEDMLG
jgi:hypothetical protein